MTERRIGIFTTDAALVVTSWDASLASMSGTSSESAVGRPLASVIPDLEARHLLATIREPLDTGAARVLAPALHHYLVRCPAPRGTSFDAMQQRVVIGPLRDGDAVVGLAVTIEDVSERLEREQALAAELRRASPDARMRAIAALEAHEPIDGLGPLGDALGDDDWQVRRTAARALANRRDPAVVQALVSALRDQHRNFSVLSSALQVLSTSGIDVTAALLDLLRDADADLRIQAALALGSQQGRGVVDALLGALDDPDANVRFHAIETLGKHRPPAAVDRLAAIAESDDFFLAFPALDALARINDPAVAPRLLPLLSRPLVGDQAADVLGQIGDEEAVAPLVAALDRPESSVTQITDALAAIQRRHQNVVGLESHIADVVRRAITPAAARRLIDAAAHASGDPLKNLVVVLGWLRGPQVERALTHLLGTPAVHHELIEAIVRFGAAMVDRLIEQAGADDASTRKAAAIALGRIGDGRAVPALTTLLADPDRDLRLAAAGALARIGDPRGFAPLLALLGDDDLAVRHAAVGALNAIGHPEMAGRIATLLDDRDARVRESAVKIAGYFGYAECAAGLLARCCDDDEVVRAAALEHSAYLDDERVLPRLVDAVRHDTPRARAAAAQALAYASAPEALAALRDALADRDSWVRYFAAASLGRQRDAASLPMLRQAAADDDHPHVRLAAVEAIGTIGGAQSAAALAALAAAPPLEVAVAAVAALGETGAEQAMDPLHRALTAHEPALRIAAASALVRLAQPPAVERLAWTAAADHDPSVAHAAIDALGRIGGGSSPSASAAIEALTELAADPAHRAEAVAALARVPPDAIPRVGDRLRARDPHVRHAVVEALGRLSHPTASAYLQAALDDGDALVRRHAVVVLGRLGTRGVVRSFARMAHADPSDAVRRAADAALRRSGAGEVSE